MNPKTRNLTQPQKFQILHRDGFKCRYCGALPGSESLEVDHLIPVSFGGSDNPCNLAASCKTCNRRRSDQALFPSDMIVDQDNEGWHIIKVWGIWTIKSCPGMVAVAGAVYGNHDSKVPPPVYWFNISRAHGYWEQHILNKAWPLPHRQEDFVSCLQFAREMTHL